MFAVRVAAPQDYANILWALAVFQQQRQQQQQAEGAAAVANISSGRWSSSRHGIKSHAPATVASDGHSGNVPPPLYNSSTRHSSSTHSTNSSSSGQVSEPLLQAWAAVTWRYTQPARAGLSAADATQLLWAASQLGRSNKHCWPDSDWLQQFWIASRRQFSSSAAAAGLDADASPQQQRQQQQADAFVYNAQALTVCMWAGLRMCAGPPGSWLVAALPLLQQRLAELQPAAACQLLYVLARQQHRPSPAFMQQLLSRLQLDSHQLEPRAFACVLWSLGRLGFRPGDNWCAVVLQHLNAHVRALGRRELGNVVFGLAMLQLQVPEELMEALQERTALVAQPQQQQQQLLQQRQQQQQQQQQQHSGGSQQPLDDAAWSNVRLAGAAVSGPAVSSSISSVG
jgi:hypothetical protein